MGAGGQRGLRDPEDIQAIIDRILASPRAQETRAFSSRTFADEPILRRGSQMPGYLPERCREMRELAQSPELRGRPEAYVFYRQARLMADYEDDLPYHGTFEHYFPTYQAMSNRQLRGYFTWRATVRRGDVRRTSLSFAFVYLYELLCDVGVEPGEQGFRAIERFWWAYRGLEPRIDRYVRRWLRDYAVWHDLPHALVEPYVSLSFDRALVALRDGIASWEGRPPARGLATPLGLIVPREREGLAAPAGSDAGAGAWAGGADKDAGVGAHAARSGADGPDSPGRTRPGAARQAWPPADGGGARTARAGPTTPPSRPCSTRSTSSRATVRA